MFLFIKPEMIMMREKFDFKPQREKEVWEACNVLYAEGLSVKEITGKAVAEELVNMGLREGNPNYRYKYINTWLQHQGLSKEGPLEQPIMRQPTDVIVRSAEIFRKSIEETIEQEYEAKFQETQKLTELASKEMQKQAVELDKQCILFQTMLKEHEQIKADRKQLITEMTQLHKDKASLALQLSTLEQSYQILKANQDQHYQDYKQRSEKMLSHLREERDQSNKLMRQERKENQDIIEKTRRVLSNEIESIKKESIKLKQDLHKKELLVNSTKDENQELNSLNRALDNRIKSLEKEKEEIKHRLQQSEKLLSVSESKREEARENAKENKKLVQMNEREMANYIEQVGYLKGQLKQLEKQPKRTKKLKREI